VIEQSTQKYVKEIDDLKQELNACKAKLDKIKAEK
jgi:hypothetical protein